MEWDGWDVGVGRVGRDGSGVAASSCEVSWSLSSHQVILFLTAAGSLLLAFNSFLPGFLGQNSVGFTTVADSGNLESIKEEAFRVSLPTILLTSVPSRDCLNLFFGPDSSSVLGLFGKPVC